jgi:hypothetical protein
MGSVAATGLAYCHQTFGDGVSRGLFLRVCDFLASETPLSPEGLFLPMSGTETCMSFATFSCVRESIGYAWELTGDEKYLRAGLRDIEDYMVSTIPLAARPPVRIKNGYQVVVSTGNAISITWRDNLRFFCYADRAGLLRDF